MIPVALQPEPAIFDERVRKRGQHWLREQGWPLEAPPVDASQLPAYWCETQKELWTAYSGICAYLCIYFEWPLGAQSTDHFVAKSSHAGQAYEWNNFRLSCLGANRNKNRFDDVLDPFEIASETFTLNFDSGEIRVNSSLLEDVRLTADQTIRRLKLDAPECNRMRAEHYEFYVQGDVSANYLQRKSPFVWQEMVRQGLIP